jgi:hypothetical protein
VSCSGAASRYSHGPASVASASGEGGGWNRPSVDELFGCRFYSKIETLQRARAKQDEIIRLAEHDVIRRAVADGVFLSILPVPTSASSASSAVKSRATISLPREDAEDAEVFDR